MQSFVICQKELTFNDDLTFSCLWSSPIIFKKVENLTYYCEIIRYYSCIICYFVDVTMNTIIILVM